MSAPVEARRVLVLHDRPLVVGLITLTLSHGSFVVRAAGNLAEAMAILAGWSPDMSVVDMDHDDSAALLKLLGVSNSLKRSETPVLGLTRRSSLKTRLRAFDLGVDDILTMPFSPAELLARAIVISQARPVAPRELRARRMGVGLGRDDPGRLVAVGRPAEPGLAVRLRQAWRSGCE